LSVYIANSLAPAKILDLELDEKEKKAKVKVSPDKLSLAIGKNGQNVRLAARLTGWKIDIIEASPEGEKKVADSEGKIDKEEKSEDVEKKEKTDKEKKSEKKEDKKKK